MQEKPQIIQDSQNTYVTETPMQVTFGVFRHNFTCRNQQCIHRCRISLTSRKDPCSVAPAQLDALFSSLCNSLELEEAAPKNGQPGQKTLTSLASEVK